MFANIYDDPIAYRDHIVRENTDYSIRKKEPMKVVVPERYSEDISSKVSSNVSSNVSNKVPIKKSRKKKKNNDDKTLYWILIIMLIVVVVVMAVSYYSNAIITEFSKGISELLRTVTYAQQYGQPKIVSPISPSEFTSTTTPATVTTPS